MDDDIYNFDEVGFIIGIIIYDTVLGLSVLYECKLFADDLWILALGPLVVVSTRITRSELWLAFDEPMCLELTDRGRVTYT